MSEVLARAAIERMHLSEVAVAHHYTGLAADLRQMATADRDEEARDEEARKVDLCSAFGLEGERHHKPFAFAGGVAIIPVSGTLINRFGESWGYVTGYNFIRRQMNQALADDDVEAIVFDLNSYGGMVAGCFELSDDIHEARGQKPMIGVIDSNCYSACYAIGSALDRLYITPSGGAGSVGVMTMHVDMSGMLDNVGFNVTLIHAGKNKVDGHPFAALPDSVKADIQAGVDKTYGTFVSTVARNRNLDEGVVRNTEARIYRAEEAVSLGLVDAIATPAVAVQTLFSELSGSNSQEENAMNVKTTQKPGGVADDTQAEIVDTEKVEAGARTSERERISAIMSCEEAEGRSSLASHLALKTDTSPDAAKAILAASPKEAAEKVDAPAAAPANPFKEAMDAGKHPEVGVDGGGGGDDPAEEPHMRIIRAQENATGLTLIEGSKA